MMVEKVLKNMRAVTAVMAIVAGLSLAGVAQGPYKVTDRWKIDGAARWDYLSLDSVTHEFFLTHGDRVDVIDMTTGKVRGSVTGLKGIHGVVLPADGRFGFVSDGGANAVVVFDRKSFQVVKSIPVGTGPDAIVYEPVTNTVWAFNGRSQNVTMVDVATQAAVATIPLPGRPEFTAADGRGLVFVNIEDKNMIVRLDAKTRTLTASWPLAKCEGPGGLAMDRERRRLFATCDDNIMAVVDADSGKIVAMPAIGNGPDAAWYDANRRRVFSSNGAGTLTIISQKSADEYVPLQTLVTQKSARTMALDEATGKIYLAAGEYGPAPAATAENPRPRPTPIPGTFVILVVSP